jgi:hypothetical protein
VVLDRETKGDYKSGKTHRKITIAWGGCVDREDAKRYERTWKYSSILIVLLNLKCKANVLFNVFCVKIVDSNYTSCSLKKKLCY